MTPSQQSEITVTVYMTPSQQSGLPCDGRLHSGFWPGLAGRQWAPEPALEQRHPFRRPHRLSDGGPALDPGRRLRVGRRCQKRSKIGDQRSSPNFEPDSKMVIFDIVLYKG